MFSANREPREPSMLGWLRPRPSLGRSWMVPGMCGGGVPLAGGPRIGLSPPCVVRGVRAGPGLMTATPSCPCGILDGGCVGDCGGEAGPTNIDELFDAGSGPACPCPGPP